MEHRLLRCKDLTKCYDGKTYALEDVNIDIEAGKIYGLIGRNGAGKTTFLKLLAKYLIATKGSIDFDGSICLSRDYQHYFLRLKCRDLYLLARENFPNWDEKFFQQLVSEVDFPLKKKYDKVSRGNQNLFGIMLALASGSDLILLDEPYTGLDPVNRKIIYSHILKLNEEKQKTFIISSHLVTELEYLLQDVIMIHSGKVLIHDDLEAIKSNAYSIVLNKDLLPRFEKRLKVVHKEVLANQVTLKVYGKMSHSVLDELSKYGAQVQGMDLQDLMIALSLNGGAIA